MHHGLEQLVVYGFCFGVKAEDVVKLIGPVQFVGGYIPFPNAQVRYFLGFAQHGFVFPDFVAGKLGFCYVGKGNYQGQ